MWSWDERNVKPESNSTHLFIFYFRPQSENSLKDNALYCLVQLRCSDCDHACLRINSCQKQKQNMRASRAGEESRWWVNGNTYVSSPRKLCEICGVFFPNSLTAFSSIFCEHLPKQCILRAQWYFRRLGSLVADSDTPLTSPIRFHYQPFSLFGI